MIVNFDMHELSRLLRDFYNVTSIRITVFDDKFNELTAYPEQDTPVCWLIKKNPEHSLKCRICDKAACETVSRRRTAYTYTCHAGLTESIVPIYVSNLLVGYLFFGQILCYASQEEAIRQIKEKTGFHRPEEQTALCKACGQEKLLSRDYVASAASLLSPVAQYLAMSRIITLRQQDLPVQLDEYLNRHFTEDISIETLCRHFNISRTVLYEIASQSYGKGLAAHIRELRLDKARALLTDHPEMSVMVIAEKCGFPDYNYFITVFRKQVGLSPRQYRMNMPDEKS